VAIILEVYFSLDELKELISTTKKVLLDDNDHDPEVILTIPAAPVQKLITPGY
jgi:hypothetical protein